MSSTDELPSYLVIKGSMGHIIQDCMLLIKKITSIHLSQFHSYYPKRGTKLLEVTKYYVLRKSAICIYNGLFCISFQKSLNQPKKRLPTHLDYFFFLKTYFMLMRDDCMPNSLISLQQELCKPLTVL